MTLATFPSMLGSRSFHWRVSDRHVTDRRTDTRSNAQRLGGPHNKDKRFVFRGFATGYLDFLAVMLLRLWEFLAYFR